MPELPSITIYVERIRALLHGHALRGVRVRGPSLVRTVEPPIRAAVGRVLVDASRLGKRIVLTFDDELHLAIHLMISGRLRWRGAAAAVPAKGGLAAFDFDHGTLLLTEASTRKRASLHVVQGAAALAGLDPGGVEVLDTSLQVFAAALRRENRTLKRALTDPRILSGIGNAFSDEILHRARLSPMALTSRLDDAEMASLYDAAQSTLREWVERLRARVGDGFPEKVTAFEPSMRVHGKFRLPCPECGAPIQRIRYADNDANYCARCQNAGRLLADRSLSRLLKGDWPKTLAELDELLP